MPGQLYPIKLFIKLTSKANREIWVSFGDVIFFLAGPVWEFSSYFLDTSFNQRIFFVLKKPRNVGILVLVQSSSQNELCSQGAEKQEQGTNLSAEYVRGVEQRC